jgi:hypothetical protein
VDMTRMSATRKRKRPTCGMFKNNHHMYAISLKVHVSQVYRAEIYLDGCIVLQNATQYKHAANKARYSVSAGQYSTKDVSESECGVVLRTCCLSRLFYEADRGPRLAALPENRPRRSQAISDANRGIRRVVESLNAQGAFRNDILGVRSSERRKTLFYHSSSLFSYSNMGRFRGCFEKGFILGFQGAFSII